MRRAVVTGGGGYFGHRLGTALAAQGYSVVLLDVAPPPPDAPLPLHVVFAGCDVHNGAALRSHFKGASVVFHVASYGMSGRSQLDGRRVEAVNVGGTEAVIKACVACGVPRLVYTSTCNVVFGGQRIDRGDESLPYWPQKQHVDIYSATKARAERLVLAADGAPLKGSGGGGAGAGANGKEQRPPLLRTAAVRATAIWGPGEQRHLPRVAQYTEAGLYRFTFGRPDSRADFVHVDNLVQIHLLAAEGLTAERDYVAAGQAYFANDGEGQAINNHAFFERLVVGLGHPPPTGGLRFPLWLVFWVAWLLELLFRAVGRHWDFSRYFLLTRAEVYKAGQHHTFSIAKARRELGYEPRRHEFQPVVDWFLGRGYGTKAARAAWAERQRVTELAAAAAAAEPGAASEQRREGQQAAPHRRPAAAAGSA